MAVQKRIFSFIVALTLLTSVIPGYVNAAFEQSDAGHAFVVSESQEEITIYKEETEESEILITIPNGSEIMVLSEGPDYSKISYFESETGEVLTGYVKNEFLQMKESHTSDDEKMAVEEDSSTSEKDGELIGQTESPAEEGGVHADQETDNVNKATQEAEESGELEASSESKESADDSEQISSSQEVSTMSLEAASVEESTILSGIALKDPTPIYSDDKDGASILKSYAQGSLLKFRSTGTDWYATTVYINGKAVAGYIRKSDVEVPVDPQTNLKGIVRNISLNVYSKASTSSSVLKSYAEGAVLRFKTFTSQWYVATVYVNGKARTGYIFKNDVINLDSLDPTVLTGIAVHKKLSVYAKPSTSSTALKSYSEGTTVKYKAYTANWYQTTVYVNGKSVSGYIHKNDVIGADEPQKLLEGIVKHSRLNVYGKVSNSSSVLKSYSEGSTIKYRTFTDNWYQTTVYVNGEPKKGYIQKSDVIDADAPQEDLKGIVNESRLYVYSRVSKSSSALKSYPRGSILRFKTFTDNWYISTVYVNGQRKTGYIYKGDVETAASEQTLITRIAQAPTGVNVYSEASTASSILKSYSKGSSLKVKTFTSKWYEATVYVNGKRLTGYIKKTDMQRGLRGKVIVIDPGHGDFDPGALQVEKTLNLQTAKQLESILKAAGANVVMTRSSDTFLALSERVDISHYYNADAFISIHYNSNPNPSAHGIDTYYWATNADEQELAAYIQEEVIEETGLYNRGVHTGDFHVIRENRNPAILVELGFLSNPTELAIVSSESYQKKAATGIWKGLERYFNQ
ncbi:N-acetylmuramoyl-L-alanine amidase [Cytobacillus firmus]|uniref:N-acetylmuramoyl-L-alanine amidase n=1 Tax=Cytobacillus firmus TaxID=1399 RepID=UPI001C95DCC7|nr:N-acetylmuramoyl-L-alanine amidase [Cytobacillus firmus]MBY6052135.1 N-acetylmuramoyl-L-alanine amidase [Cytobacillus firmus]